MSLLEDGNILSCREIADHEEKKHLIF